VRLTHTLIKVAVFTLALAIPLAPISNAQSFRVPECATTSNSEYAQSLNQIGGMHITSQGTFRILVVFVSFQDDSTVHPFWPAHNPPLYLDQFIDPDTSTRSPAAFNLTDYFYQMSLGKFHVIGDAIWIEMPHSQSEYANGSYARANTTVLKESVDPIVDFAKYDNWTNSAGYVNTNAPDGIVDMVVMVWRTTIFQMLGEASLGYRPGFDVDGTRIEMGFPERYDYPLGSGVTCEYPYHDDPAKAMRTMVHEMGHWLLGGQHPYTAGAGGKHQYWGILCAPERISSCANAYERERLGWITVPAIPPGDGQRLADFISTGAAFKYHPPAGDVEEYFYLENHQLNSAFDDVTRNPEDRGLWILHQQGIYQGIDNISILPADGRWNWESPGVSTDCYGQPLPIFVKGTPAVGFGLSHRDQLPVGGSLANWMYVFRNPDGVVNCGAFFAGETFRGSFDAAVNPVFSPYSNPATSTWSGAVTSFSLEVVGDTAGVLTLRHNSNPLDSAPARRYLGLDPSVQASGSGVVSLAWGDQWPDGQPAEPDVDWSELDRKVGDAGGWVRIYQGPATSWADSAAGMDSLTLRYRVRVRDAQWKYSAWSDSCTRPGTAPTGIGNPGLGTSSLPASFALPACYPNPFNACTRIGYSIPASREYGEGSMETNLVVYDILGREVAVLVNEKKGPGNYHVTFDASGLASGVYLYRLTAGQYVECRKMILMK
jgi:M6 family metalloprotease-like protein